MQNLTDRKRNRGMERSGCRVELAQQSSWSCRDYRENMKNAETRG